MAVLIIAFLLGAAMVAASYRAHQSQRRAEVAEGQATERLWNSFLSQARAERLSTEAGHRGAALTAISNAASIRPSSGLRDEAIASLGLRDVVREVAWPLQSRAYGFNFDPDLNHYVVSYASDALSMFRLADNALVRTFRAGDAGLDTNSAVKEFFFSQTGRYIVMQYTTGVVVLWERDSGRAAHVLGREPGSERIAWLPTLTADDDRLCARSATRRDRVLLIGLASGDARAFEVPGINDSLRLSPQGDVFSWFRGNEIFFHEAQTGIASKTLTAPAEVASMWWDAKGEQFSIACRDSTIYVWNPKSGRPRQLGGRAVNPWVQQFSPDGTLLATAGSDGTSRFWDVEEARLLAQTTDGRAFLFGRDGERIGFGTPGREVGVWRITRPAGYRMLQGAVSDYASVWQQDLSPDGNWTVWSPPPWVSRPGFELFDLASDRAPLWVPASRNVAVGFHPVEPRLFVAGREGLRTFELPNPGAVGEPMRLGEPRTIPLPDGFEPRTFSLDGTGRRAVVMSTSGHLTALDLQHPGQFVPLEGQVRKWEPPGPASRTGSGGLAMSMDGRWAVAGWGDRDNGNPVIWDTQTGTIVDRLATSASHAAFSPDGRWLATVSASSCTLWAVGTWQQQWKRPRVALLAESGAAAFTLDGSLMAFSRSIDELELVVPDTGQHLASLGGAAIVSIKGLRLSADGHILTVAGAEGKIHTWNLRAIRDELAKLHLDWTSSESERARSEPGVAADRSRGESPVTPLAIAGLGLGAVGLAGLLGLIVLRRHERLTADFVLTTELAAQQARELAAERELGELKNRFVSMVSHEFRTPLGITMSAVELLRNHLDVLNEAKRKELFDDIFGSTRHMASLMEQVLLLGRVEAGKLGYRPAPLDLSGLCHKLADESLSATNRRCLIEVTVDDALGDVRADESLLRHIFSNLLSNAVKYSPGGASVQFSAHRDGTGAIFIVRDRGIGIPDVDVPKLFQAFHRAANVGDTPGTGLGLVIVKRCVDLHGGSIEVQSKPGEGTVFTVRLPLLTQN